MKNFLFLLISSLVIIIVIEIVYLLSLNSLFLNDPKTKLNAATTAYSYWLNKKPILTLSTKTDVSEGIITGINTKGGSLEVNGVKYDYALMIDLQNNKGARFSFIYDESDLTKINVKSKIGRLSISKLTKGDHIIISETIDLLSKNNAIIYAEIEKK